MLLFFAPTYFIASLIFSLFNHKSRTYVWAHIYETALAPFLLISALTELFLSQKLKFSVTPKDSASNKTHFAFKVGWPHLLMAAISLIALGVGIHKMLTDVNYIIPVYLVNLFWLLYNLMGITASIIICFEKQRFRESERFPAQNPLTMTFQDGKTIPVKLIDISLQSCAVEPMMPLEHADDFAGSPVLLTEPNGLLEIDGFIFRSRGWGKKLIIKFKGESREQKNRLVNFIFDQQETGYGRFDIKSENFLRSTGMIFTRWYKTLFRKN